MTTEPKTEPTPEPEPLSAEEFAGIYKFALKQFEPFDRVSASDTQDVVLRLLSTIAARDEALEKTRALVAEVRRVCDEAPKAVTFIPSWVGPDKDTVKQVKFDVAARLRPHLPEGKGL